MHPATTPYQTLGDERCRLGEGAAFDPLTGTAWWFDILGKCLFEARDGLPRPLIHSLPVMASALGVVVDGRQVIAGQDGLYLRRTDTGAMARFLPIAGPPGIPSRSNDGRVHPSGTFWVSTMGMDAQPGAGTIRALHRGALTTLFGGLAIPNAICFSADGGTGYFADSATNILHRVALDPATGLPVGAPTTFVRATGPGVLDGAVIDADGLIWCARWGGGRVEAYAPDGRLVHHLPVPARQPSCPVFIGAKRDRLLVTSAYDGMTQAERDADPHHGRTFVLQLGTLRPGTRGSPEPRVLLS